MKSVVNPLTLPAARQQSVYAQQRQMSGDFELALIPPKLIVIIRTKPKKGAHGGLPRIYPAALSLLGLLAVSDLLARVPGRPVSRISDRQARFKTASPLKTATAKTATWTQQDLRRTGTIMM
ncbi:hypothetical protein ACPCYX_07045 [Pseudomonas fluorescens]|uniref:hypothetical protein n=1 Tax=Pseudomonas fluorescens TaxID=294 RepID=UPI003C284842